MITRRANKSASYRCGGGGLVVAGGCGEEWRTTVRRWPMGLFFFFFWPCVKQVTAAAAGKDKTEEIVIGG